MRMVASVRGPRAGVRGSASADDATPAARVDTGGSRGVPAQTEGGVLPSWLSAPRASGRSVDERSGVVLLVLASDRKGNRLHRSLVNC